MQQQRTRIFIILLPLFYVCMKIPTLKNSLNGYIDTAEWYDLVLKLCRAMFLKDWSEGYLHQPSSGVIIKWIHPQTQGVRNSQKRKETCSFHRHYQGVLIPLKVREMLGWISGSQPWRHGVAR